MAETQIASAGGDVRTSDIGLRTSLCDAHLTILSLIRDGHNQASICRALDKPRQTVNSALKKLESLGIITQIGAGRPTQYAINDDTLESFGHDVRSSLGTNANDPIFNLHNFIFTADFQPQSRPRYEEREGHGRYQFGNGMIIRSAGAKFGVFRGQERMRDCTVQTTPKSITIRIPGYREGLDDVKLLARAFNDAQKVKEAYQDRYGVTLCEVRYDHHETERDLKTWEEKGPMLRLKDKKIVADDDTPRPNMRMTTSAQWHGMDKRVPLLVWDTRNAVNRIEKTVSEETEKIKQRIEVLNGGVTLSHLVNLQYQHEQRQDKLEQKLEKLVGLLEKKEHQP